MRARGSTVVLFVSRRFGGVSVSSGSGSGSGADQHLLALLRAIRLRQAAPDAVAAGVADTAAALTDPENFGRPALPSGEQPPRPGWALPQAPGAEKQRNGETPANSGDAPGTAAPGNGEGPGTAVTSNGGGPGTAVSGQSDSAAPSGARATPQEFAPEATADFFGRPKAAGPARAGDGGRSAASGAGAGALSPFDHGPQLRPAGLPPLDSRRRGDEIEAADPMRAAHQLKSGEQIRAGQPREAVGQRDADHAPPAPAPHGQVAGIGRVGAAIDGMDPADDALLRETQRLLSTSLTFAGGPDEVAERFRAALLQAQPVLLEALPGSARTQTEQLARGLTWLVHHLDQPPVLVTGCGRLGAALAECGVRPQQLQFVGAALAEAIRSGMPPGAWRQDFDGAWRSTWQHAYEWIVHGETLTQYEPTVWTAVVVEHELRRHDLAVIRLRPYLPMPFRPGQYARVEVPELPGVWRPYSLAGKPRRDDLLELHVRAKTRSGVSGTLVYRLEVGDHVRLRKAEGEMGIPADPGRNLLMIAGDTGVAPLKALLTELADTDDPRSAVLFWGVRNLDELYDIDEIAEIARSARRATVVPVVSEGDPGPYASGLVTDAVAAYGEWSDHEVYLAGPPLMLAATSAALRLLGVAPERIHHDAPE